MSAIGASSPQPMACPGEHLLSPGPPVFVRLFLYHHQIGIMDRGCLWVYTTARVKHMYPQWGPVRWQW